MKSKSSTKFIIQQLSQNLEDLESYTKDLWQFLPLPLCYVNPFQIILDTNLALENFLNWDSLELIGEKMESLFNNKSQAQKIHQKILKEKRVISEEGEVLTKDGKKKIVNISASSRGNSKGHIIGYYLAFLDISELKRLQTGLEKEVQERTRELQRRVGELETFRKAAVGRELKMIELKKEIAQLKRESQTGNRKA
jgi:PAS domain S-box-containing protein